MKNTKSIIGLFIVLIIFSSCEKGLMKSIPETNNLAIFDEYVKLVKEKHAMLTYKNVDIDKLSQSLRSLINDNTSNEDLMSTLGAITLSLRDGHSVLFDDAKKPTIGAQFDITEGFPPGIDLNILNSVYTGNMKSLSEGEEGRSRAIWGTLPQDNQIGYIWIPSWNVPITDTEIEQIFADIKNTKGLIFDQRLNGGGDPLLAVKFASYFTNKPIYTGIERFKTGPGSNDFSDSRVTMQPSGSSNTYLKPVMALTDRNVYSASTTFLYSLDPIERIKTVGQKTGGGSGSVADGFLANGWYWSLSTSDFIDTKGRHLDDGLDPDIMVIFNPKDKSKDEVIERAIQELQ